MSKRESTQAERIGWHSYFLGIAQAVAARGDCSRRQVGAVLVRTDMTVASVGYNGTARGGLSCLRGQCPRAHTDVEPGSSYDTGPGSCIASHAEMNCIAFAREDTTGFTLYVTTEPCGGCRKLIRSARLKEIVWPDGLGIGGYYQEHL